MFLVRPGQDTSGPDERRQAADEIVGSPTEGVARDPGAYPGATSSADTVAAAWQPECDAIFEFELTVTATSHLSITAHVVCGLDLDHHGQHGGLVAGNDERGLPVAATVVWMNRAHHTCQVCSAASQS